MSVAFSLAALRETSKRPTQRPSSIARSELAATAHNAITLLQRADNQLHKFVQPLLLLSPERDRLTLAPEEERQLQREVVALVRRLAPAFLVRHTQTIIDWLLVGLSLATHGSDDEYDQLIIAALPFCETPVFENLINRMAPLRPKWTFLSPVVEQNKPPALSFLVKCIPAHILPILIDSALKSASMQLQTTPIASLLANLLTRRLLNQSETLSLTIASITALQKLTSKKFTTKVQTFPKDLVAAMLSCLAVTMSSSFVDHSILQTASHTCAHVILSCDTPQVLYIASACLVLTSSNLSAFVPTRVARNLLQSSALKTALAFLNSADAATLYCALVLASVGDHPEQIAWNVLDATLSDSSFLNELTVAQLLIDVFRKMSSDPPLKGLSGEKAVEGLISLLAPLARGRFAEAVDRALREHFKRRKKRGAENRYKLVDEAFAKGLHGTQFATLKAGKDTSTMALTVALDHPEPAVRQAAITQLTRRDIMVQDDDSEGFKSLWTKLMSMIGTEEDIQIVVSACNCILHLPVTHDISSTLTTIVNRYKAEYGKKEKKKHQKSKKNKKKALALSALFVTIISYCERISQNSTDSTDALLSGFVAANLVPEMLSDKDKARIKRILGKRSQNIKIRKAVRVSDKGDIVQLMRKAIQSLVSKDSQELLIFVEALSAWDSKWTIEASKLWFEELQKSSCSLESERGLKTVTSLLLKVFDTDAHLRHHVIHLLVENSRLFCTLPVEQASRKTSVAELWTVVARNANNSSCKTVLSSIVTELGLPFCLSMLKNASCSDNQNGAKTVSLNWYVNICVLHPSEVVRRESMDILVMAIYGSDGNLTKKAVEVSKRSQLKVGVKKRERKTELWHFLSTVSELPVGYTREVRAGELERIIVDEIHRWTIERIDTPVPLTYSKRKKTKSVVEILLPHLVSLQGKSQDMNAYLRALYGHVLQSEDYNSIASLLVSHIESLQSFGAEPEEIILENMARLTLMLLEASPSTNSKPFCNISFAQLLLSEMKQLPDLDTISDDISGQTLAIFLGLSAMVIKLMEKCGKTEEYRVSLLAYLFAYSTSSSRLGKTARGYIDCLGQKWVTTEEVVLLLNSAYVNLSPSRKRAKGTKRSIVQNFSNVARETGLGVLESLLRWTPADTWKKYAFLSGSLDSLKCSLFDYLVQSKGLGEDDRSSLGDLEYELSLLLQVQSSLYVLDPLRPSKSFDVGVLANMALYSRQDAAAEDAPMVAMVRRNGVELLEVLAPIFGSDLHGVLAPVIESLVSSRDTKRTLVSLQAFVPALVKSGSEFKQICSWISDALYGSGSLSDSTRSRSILSSCCRLVPDVRSATEVALTHVERQMRSSSEEIVARECSLLLLEASLSPVDDLTTLRRLPERIRCRTAYSVFQNPGYVDQLYALANDMGPEEESVLSDAFAILFLELLVCDDSTGRADAIAALVAILPLPSFGLCIKRGLSSRDKEIRTRSMNIVKDRFAANDALLIYTWNMDTSILDTNKSDSIEESFLNEIGTMLCDITAKEIPNTSCEERIVAGSTIEKLVLTMGSKQRHTVLSFAEKMIGLIEVNNVVEYVEEAETNDAYCRLTANAFFVFSSFLATLGKHAVPFIPVVLNGACDVLEAIFKTNAPTPPSEAAVAALVSLSDGVVRFFTEVLDSCPSFLGARALQRLVTLSMSSQVQVVTDLLHLSMKKASPGTVVTALTGAVDRLEKNDAQLGGVCTVMKALGAGLGEMHKSEVKLHCNQLLKSLTTCIEYGRDDASIQRLVATSRDVESNAKKTDLDDTGVNSVTSRLSMFKEVDESCGDALTYMTLKLSEARFKQVFNALVQWCDGGSLSSGAVTACETLGVQVTSNVMRATPFYCIVLKVFQTLQPIMVPYVFELLEKILGFASLKQSQFETKKPNGSKKNLGRRKRKLAEVDEDLNESLCFLLLGSEERLIDTCLDILIFLLKQSLGPEFFTATVAAKIQNGLLSALDNSDGDSEKVLQAMRSLAMRITALGKFAESKEESRELLVAFSRSLLLRTREKSAALRAAALRISSAAAQAVGDEYMVTLPESMPVLAEVIDDEDSGVQKEAKRFVEVMEGLAGEPIMAQLK
ncbi:U3 small nucleolar RNA-associated protein 10 [Gracilariopsis chorda]|uniref:HEAT repeat-containing protein 1 n=1 Tax=Gracilariopsis chorda TaxID=448386 RepID=A0A2V3IVQ0_9FLOR|nr:U3 small nucleolar RNA-associated protein 10 [Gracilariopsis chorda]|eukprot:PXF46155.1 U3 small nucleolar RNA-associated protein 10 [Gracilariopsis chorda]